MQMDEAQRKMESYFSTASLMQINEEKYALIRDGIPVTVKKRMGRPRKRKLRSLIFRIQLIRVGTTSWPSKN